MKVDGHRSCVNTMGAQCGNDTEGSAARRRLRASSTFFNHGRRVGSPTAAGSCAPALGIVARTLATPREYAERAAVPWQRRGEDDFPRAFRCESVVTSQIRD